MAMWLLEQSVRGAMLQARNIGFTPTAEQQARFDARIASGDNITAMDHRILTTAGNVAEISIKGVLTTEPSFLAMIFGGGNTTYPEIIAAIAAAEQDDSITSIVYAIDSPGGHFDGLFDVIAAMEATTKPTKAILSNVTASAAFALASQADELVASNIAVRIGSVGVVYTMYNDENEISITSTDAPKKRPDIKTAEGVAMVVEELDAMHEIFVDAIATGRKVTADKVNADFGQGGTVLANEALKRGMIDAVASKTTKTTTASGGKPETIKMDLVTLKAQHPATFAAAVEQGTNEERDRVTAHLTMGDASGDMKTALTAVEDGSLMTQTLQAKYMTAGMNRSNIEDHQKESVEANAGDNANSEEQSAETSGEEQVAAKLEAMLGLGAEL